MRVLSSLSVVFAVSALAFTGAGCFVHDSSSNSSSGGNPPPQNEASTTIDKGGALTTDPGSGVAILVEYEGPTPQSGSTPATTSRWNIQTTCDTLKSTYACNFDVYARSTGITFANTIHTEGSDFVDQSNGQLHAGLVTSTDTDGFAFDVPQGQDIEVEVYLDGDSAMPYVFWVGHGVTHAGALTNPMLFVPAG